MSAGRTARGERWNFQRYLSRNEIERDGKKLLIDALLLDAEDGAHLARLVRGTANRAASRTGVRRQSAARRRAAALCWHEC